MLISTVLTILFSLQSIIMISLSILDPIKFRIAIHIFRILLFLNPITEHELLSIVLNLPNKKSSGHDLVNCPLIKEIIQVISKPLVFIINLSLTTGIVPDSMKIARVMPIHKNGDCHLVNNYRLISILTSFSKILERTVYIRTSQFLEKHKILSDWQFGFGEKHSTTHAILQLIDKIRVDRDESLHTLGIFLDLSKAFDTIDHSILLSKLSFYGIRGTALEWYRNYLSNRKQFVCIDGKESSPISLTCGIPPNDPFWLLSYFRSILMIFLNSPLFSVPMTQIYFFLTEVLTHFLTLWIRSLYIFPTG